MFPGNSFDADQRYVQENKVDSKYSLRAVNSWYFVVCLLTWWEVLVCGVYNACDSSYMLLSLHVLIYAFRKKNTQELLQVSATVIEWLLMK